MCLDAPKQVRIGRSYHTQPKTRHSEGLAEAADHNDIRMSPQQLVAKQCVFCRSIDEVDERFIDDDSHVQVVKRGHQTDHVASGQNVTSWIIRIHQYKRRRADSATPG